MHSQFQLQNLQPEVVAVVCGFQTPGELAGKETEHYNLSIRVLKRPLLSHSDMSRTEPAISLLTLQDTSEVSMDQRRNVRAGDMGDPRKTPLTSVISGAIPMCKNPGRRKSERDVHAELVMLSALLKTSGGVCSLLLTKTEDLMFVGRCVCCRAVLSSLSCRPVRDELQASEHEGTRVYRCLPDTISRICLQECRVPPNRRSHVYHPDRTVVGSSIRCTTTPPSATRNREYTIQNVPMARGYFIEVELLTNAHCFHLYNIKITLLRFIVLKLTLTTNRDFSQESLGLVKISSARYAVFQKGAYVALQAVRHYSPDSLFKGTKQCKFPWLVNPNKASVYVVAHQEAKHVFFKELPLRVADQRKSCGAHPMRTKRGMEQRLNEREGETGYSRENPPTSGIVQQDSHLRKSRGGSGRGLDPGSPRREGSALTAQPQRPPVPLEVTFRRVAAREDSTPVVGLGRRGDETNEADNLLPPRAELDDPPPPREVAWRDVAIFVSVECFNARWHQRTACRKIPFRTMKHYDIGPMHFVQADTFKEHTEICKDSSTRSLQVLPAIPLVVSMDTGSTGEYDETDNAKDGMSAVESTNSILMRTQLLVTKKGKYNIEYETGSEDNHENSIDENEHDDSDNDEDDEGDFLSHDVNIKFTCTNMLGSDPDLMPMTSDNLVP
ncbi:hypothetical protein PR048_019107 [Dryococelus australis]|uniref:Uncharacterized protein n=1 Tax=Dryococelus australis TaxID=614101 RepID=A0ABQ9H2P5_9NEOP|nr:hypothetical protein PR048_019107 [Dryococelus australis]